MDRKRQLHRKFADYYSLELIDDFIEMISSSHRVHSVRDQIMIE